MTPSPETQQPRPGAAPPPVPTGSRRRILFVAEAVTLAHVARPRVLAESLDPARYEVHFAAAPAFEGARAGLAARAWPLTSIAPARFMDALARGAPVYDAATLSAYVEDDLALIDRVRPDLIVGDFRLSLAVSAPLSRVPYLALANAYWSPYTAMTRWPIPDLLPVRLFGPGLVGALFNLVRPIVFRQHARPLNRVRRRHGLAPLADMLEAYTWGDETLYLDVPQLVPTKPLPPNHRYLGPVVWEPPTRPPDWWDALPEGRPTVYVTLGSSGPAARLPALLRELADLPINLLVATAGRVEPRALPRGAWVADYLPGSRAAARSDLVISNGGSPTGYQALEHGTPVLGIASNLDQHLTMHYIAAAGAGRVLRGERLTAGGLRAAVEAMLAEPAYRVAARRAQGWLRELRAGARLAERLDAWR